MKKMDNLPQEWYSVGMSKRIEPEKTKRDRFKGEWMYVLPTESFQEYVQHPQVRRLYLTDVGYFPHAARHFRERKEGIEE